VDQYEEESRKPPKSTTSANTTPTLKDEVDEDSERLHAELEFDQRPHSRQDSPIAQASAKKISDGRVDEGDEVMWLNADEDVPVGTVGTVIGWKVKQSGELRAVVEWPKGNYAMKLSELQHAPAQAKNAAAKQETQRQSRSSSRPSPRAETTSPVAPASPEANPSPFADYSVSLPARTIMQDELTAFFRSVSPAVAKHAEEGARQLIESGCEDTMAVAGLDSSDLEKAGFNHFQSKNVLSVLKNLDAAAQAVAATAQQTTDS